jgi:CheY-like chemotaxis protein
MTTPVLIVEDDRGLAELIRDTLTDLGLESRHADTGKAALEALAAQRPPLVLLDFLLPDMSGIEFVAQAAQMPGGMPPFVSGSPWR